MDIDPQSISARQARITHIGGPTTLIEVGSLRLLSDPTFEPAGYQHPSGGGFLTKTGSSALTAEAVGPVDAVLLSHDQHGDNLDAAGRAFLSQAQQTLTTPASAGRLGGAAVGLEPWQTTTLTGADDGLTLRVTATPARHGAAEVAPALAGHVSGWVLEWSGQRDGVLYISGDTVLFEGVEEVARRYRVALALLHCGAAKSPRLGPDNLTLSGAEAAQVARLMPDALIVPVHYEGWAHFTEGRAEIEQAFAAEGLSERLRFLPMGEAVPFAL